jgi:hypothetical protein
MRVLIPWGALGFYRGVNEYDYVASKYEFSYSYFDKGMYGLSGTVCYFTPFLLGVFIPKEFYRARVVLCGDEHEKQSPYYNEVL